MNAPASYTVNRERGISIPTLVPNLWGGIVAPPGMMKSPVISCVTQPARAIETEWRETHQEAESSYQAALELQEEEIRAWKAQYQTAAKKDKPRPGKPESTHPFSYILRQWTQGFRHQLKIELHYIRESLSQSFRIRPIVGGYIRQWR